MSYVKPEKRYDRGTRVAAMIARAVGHSDLTQQEIANALGYKRPNTISMLCSGATRIPMEKAIVLAEVLDMDAAKLLSQMMEDWEPELWKTICEVYNLPISSNERKILQEFRKVTKRSDPPMETLEQRKALLEFAKTLSSEIDMDSFSFSSD